MPAVTHPSSLCSGCDGNEGDLEAVLSETGETDERAAPSSLVAPLGVEERPSSSDEENEASSAEEDIFTPVAVGPAKREEKEFYYYLLV